MILLKQKKPNIVLILADDMGYGDISCLNKESKIKTRNIDQLAREGKIFTDGHAASSVCTPSRYSLLTGRYCWRTRLKKWVLKPFDYHLIEENRLTLPQMLKDNGYDTVMVGKWHLGMDWPLKDRVSRDDFRELLSVPRKEEGRNKPIADRIDFSKPIGNGPCDYGFDYYFGVDIPNFPPYCFIENNRTVGLPVEDKPDDMYGDPGPMLPGWKLEEIMPALTRKAVNYINEKGHKQKDNPFFLYLSLTAPHTPITPLDEFKGKSKAGDYGDFVYQVDHTVGEVIQALKRNGLYESTLLIVSSDNGSPGRTDSVSSPGSLLQDYGHNPSYIFRGMKADTWDGGHRIPFIVSWPGKVEKGSICDEMISLIDLMATFSDIQGIELPEGAAEDSNNILPLLSHKFLSTEKGEADLKSCREVLIHHGGNGLFAIRRGNWKLITGTNSGGFSDFIDDSIKSSFDSPGQLYNLKYDISESNNLYNDNPEIVEELTALLLDIVNSKGQNVFV